MNATEAMVIPVNANTSTLKRVRWEDDQQKHPAPSAQETSMSLEKLTVDLRAQKKDIAQCLSMCHSHEMAMDFVKHELDARRSWFGRIETDRAENESWRSRIEGELSSLRAQREESRRERDDLAAQVRGLQKQLYGTTADGGVVAQAQLQAHAAVAAAMAPLQAHLERELASVRRHVAALRANASYNSLEESDVSEALAVPRPSELVIKGIVSATVADAEERLESRVNESLLARLATSLASASEKIQKDTEEAVFARVRAAATREGARRGLLTLVGGGGAVDDTFSTTTADDEGKHRRETELAIKRTREQDAKLEELSRGLDVVRTETALLGQETKSSVVSLDASVSAKFGEVREATASLRELVEMTDIAARRRFDKDRSETEARLSQSLEDTRKDVADTARRHAQLAASLDGLDERMRVVRETAAQVAEEAPGVRRAAQAASRIDAVEDQLARMETRIGPEAEARFTQTSSLHEDLRRRVATIEDRQSRLPMQDERARRDIQEAERRVAALEAQIVPLREQVAHIPRIQRAEVDVEHVRKRVDETSRDAAARLETHRRAMESAADLRDRRLDQLAARVAKTEDVAGTVSLSQTRIASLESDAADMREKFQRAHSELAEKSSDAFRASTAELRRALTDCDSQLESCKSLAEKASHKADACANDLHHLTIKLVHGGPITKPERDATSPALSSSQPPVPTLDAKDSPQRTNISSWPLQACEEASGCDDDPDFSVVEESPNFDEDDGGQSDEKVKNQPGYAFDDGDDESEEEEDVEEMHMSENIPKADVPSPPLQIEEKEEKIQEGDTMASAPETDATPKSQEHEEEDDEDDNDNANFDGESTPLSNPIETAVLGSLQRLPSGEVGSDDAGSWDEESDIDDVCERAQTEFSTEEKIENAGGEVELESPRKDEAPEANEEIEAEEEVAEDEKEEISSRNSEVYDTAEKNRRRQANDYSDDDDQDEIPEIPTLDDADEAAFFDQEVAQTSLDVNEQDATPPSTPHRIQPEAKNDYDESRQYSEDDDESDDDSDLELAASSYKSRSVGGVGDRTSTPTSSTLRSRLRSRGLAA